MAKNKHYTVRKRINQGKRLRLLRSRKPRLVIRKHLRTIIASVVEYHPDGDRIISIASSQELKKEGWTPHTGNIPAAYLTGYLLGHRLQKKKRDSVVVDTGPQSSVKGSALYAACKGVTDSGIETFQNAVMFPSEERTQGDHLSLKDPTVVRKLMTTIKEKIHGKG